MSVAVRRENMEDSMSMPPPPLPPQRQPPPPVNRTYKRRALFQITKVRDYNIRGRRYPSAAAIRHAPVTTLSDDDAAAAAAARHFEHTRLIFSRNRCLFCKFILDRGFLFYPSAQVFTLVPVYVCAKSDLLLYALSVCLLLLSRLRDTM